MFELTSHAAAVLAQTRAQNGLADTIGVRISTAESGDAARSGYRLDFALDPAPDDTVVESAGTKVFLAAGVAEPLGTSVLDVVETAEGEQLVLKHRTPPHH